MKRILYTFAALICLSTVLLIGGCKKTPAVNGQVASFTDALTIAGTTTNTTTNLSYDGQNRLTLVSPSSGTPTTFSYGSGSVTQTKGSAITIYQLNSAGLATSDNQGGVYVYDNNGYNITVTNTGAGTSTTNTISSGNIANTVSTTNGVATTTTYTYLSTTEYRTYGQAFFGKNSVNLINSQAVSAANASTTTYTFSYTYDSKGRVQTQTVLVGANSDVKTYAYTD